MDLCTVDVSFVEGSYHDDDVVSIGRQGSENFSVDAVAKLVVTIIYELICGFNGRVSNFCIGQLAASTAFSKALRVCNSTKCVLYAVDADKSSSISFPSVAMAAAFAIATLSPHDPCSFSSAFIAR